MAYSRASWRRPTGDAADQEAGDTYNHLQRFGHEEWLFRDEWVIDGWRYAFIQGVGRSRRALVEARQAFDVTLVTVKPDKRRRYVARIREAEALDNAQADDAVEAFKRAGWHGLMLQEIAAVGGDVSALGNVRWASHMLNVRFRLDKVDRFPLGTYAGPGDPVLGLNRYQLFSISVANESSDEAFNRDTAVGVARRVGSTLLPEVRDALRRAVGEVNVSPEHARMQVTLMRELQAEQPDARLVREEDFVDVLVETMTSIHLYEIKSDLSPVAVLRQAIGQLLEYAFRLRNPAGKMITLVAVGRAPLSTYEQEYLAHLRCQHALSLEYRVVAV
jgi:hypothetical protein